MGSGDVGAFPMVVRKGLGREERGAVVLVGNLTDVTLLGAKSTP